MPARSLKTRSSAAPPRGKTSRAAGAAPGDPEQRSAAPSTAAAAGSAALSSERRLRASLRAQEPDVQQDRARRSHEAMLDAAERLFAQGGYDGAGTPEIAAAAGVSVGTVYRYFTDKKQIFLEVVRRYLSQAYHETLDRLTPALFVGRARHETIEETVAIVFAFVDRNPRLNRAFVEMAMRDDDVAELRAHLEAAACQRLAALISAVCPREQVPDPEATAWMLHGAALECAIAVSGAGRRPPVAPARARAALTAMIERTLFPATAAASGAAQTSR